MFIVLKVDFLYSGLTFFLCYTSAFSSVIILILLYIFSTKGGLDSSTARGDEDELALGVCIFVDILCPAKVISIHIFLFFYLKV